MSFRSRCFMDAEGELRRRWGQRTGGRLLADPKDPKTHSLVSAPYSVHRMQVRERGACKEQGLLRERLSATHFAGFTGGPARPPTARSPLDSVEYPGMQTEGTMQQKLWYRTQRRLTTRCILKLHDGRHYTERTSHSPPFLDRPLPSPFAHLPLASWLALFGFWGEGRVAWRTVEPLSLFPFSPADGKSGSILSDSFPFWQHLFFRSLHCLFRWPSLPRAPAGSGLVECLPVRSTWICATSSGRAPLKKGHPFAPPFARHSCQVPRRMPYMLQAGAGKAFFWPKFDLLCSLRIYVSFSLKPFPASSTVCSAYLHCS